MINNPFDPAASIFATPQQRSNAMPAIVFPYFVRAEFDFPRDVWVTIPEKMVLRAVRTEGPGKAKVNYLSLEYT